MPGDTLVHTDRAAWLKSQLGADHGNATTEAAIVDMCHVIAAVDISNRSDVKR